MSKSNGKEIWKLQRPVVTSGSYNEVLCYTEDGGANVIEVSENTIDKVFGDEFKVYVEAEIHEDTGTLMINRFVEEQDW